MSMQEKLSELIEDYDNVYNKQVKKFILNEIGNITNILMEELCQE